MKLKQWAAITLLPFLQHYAIAEIITDGSVGPAHSLNISDNQFSITQELGSLTGNNLFHSFQEFNIANGESALFTGDDSIQNVISRVTGGHESSINGILKSQVGNADFYFINPAGITFNENAQVDVPAAFHVSTAGELIFADGSSFSAINPEASILTVAEPESFGFISGQNNNLQIIGSQLAFKPGSEVSLSSNNIVITGIEHNDGNIQTAQITVKQTNPNIEPGMRLNLTSVDSATTQTIPITNLAVTTTGGDLLIENSTINASGNGAEQLAIQAGATSIHNSQLSFDNLGDQPTNTENGITINVTSLMLNQTSLTSNSLGESDAGTISIRAKEAIQLLNGGIISADTLNQGDAGKINITAGQLTIDGQDNPLLTAISSSVLQESHGDAGTVSITVSEEIQLLNGGIIGAFTFNDGDAGNVTVAASKLTIDGQDTVNFNVDDMSTTSQDLNLAAVNSGIESALNNKLSDFTGIFSNTLPNSNGSAGSIVINVIDKIQLSNGGVINSVTFGEGNAGSISIAAEQLFIDAENNPLFITGVVNSALPGSHGNAGPINITINQEIQLLNGGLISAKTFSQGNAGDITVSSEQLTIDGQNSNLLTGITNSAAADSHGDAGTVSISVNESIKLLNGGVINVDTFGQGNAGNVSIAAAQLSIDGQDSEFLTGISSSAMRNSRGNASTVFITVDETIKLLNGGIIGAFTFGEGNAGNITIAAQQLMVDGQDTLNPTENNLPTTEQDLNLTVLNSSITNILNNKLSNFTGIFSNTLPGSRGNAGSIAIEVDNDIQLLNGGLINSVTFGQGDAGNISIAADQLTIDAKNNTLFITGLVNSTLPGGNGNAGPISIVINKAIQLLNGGLISAKTFNHGNAGDITVSAEQLTVDGQNSNLFTGITNSAAIDSLGNAGTISITANETIQLLNGGVINVDTFSQGNAGDISVAATKLTIDGQDSKFLTGISSSAMQDSNGDAGTVSIKASETIQLLNGGMLGAFTFGTGNAGNININSRQLTIDGQDTINLNSNNIGINAQDSNLAAVNFGIASLLDNKLADFTGIFSNTLPASSGNAGSIAITVDDDIQLLNGALINSVTLGEGNAGSITMTTEQLLIDTENNPLFITGVLNSALPDSRGNAGPITITAHKAIQLLNGGLISAKTFSQGDAGDISVSTEQLTLDGQNSNLLTGITNAAVADSHGNAGSIKIETEQLSINGQHRTATTGIFSISDINASGKVGAISIIALEQINLEKAGTISIAALNQAALSTTVDTNIDTNQSQITIATPTLYLTQNSTITATANGATNAAPINIDVADKLLVSGSQITTEAINGNGGSIGINADNWVQLEQSQLTTSVLGKENGNGGNIIMNTPTLVLSSGFIQANTVAENANGGDIHLNVAQLIPNGESLLRGGSEPLVFNNKQDNFNIIQAASPNGINGNIDITSPELNIVGILTNVATPDLNTKHISHNPCRLIRENNLTNLSPGGTPAFQHGENYLLINRHNQVELNNLDTPSTSAPINRNIYENIYAGCAQM